MTTQPTKQHGSLLRVCLVTDLQFPSAEEYLEQKFDGPKLMPADPAACAAVRLWTHHLNNKSLGFERTRALAQAKCSLVVGSSDPPQMVAFPLVSPQLANRDVHVPFFGPKKLQPAWPAWLQAGPRAFHLSDEQERNRGAGEAHSAGGCLAVL